MASTASSSFTTDIEVTPGSPRAQAGPLPLKRGEIGYVEGVHNTPEQVRGSSPEVPLPARHPADRDNSAAQASGTPSATPIFSTSDASLVSPSTSTLVSTDSNTPTLKQSKVLRFFKPKKIPLVFGLRLTTLLIFFLQLAALGGTLTGWVLLVKIVSRNTADTFNSTAIFVHVLFAVILLGQLLFVERRIFRLRAERYAYMHPGQILPSRNGRATNPFIAFSPWNRPPLPTYAAALAESGVGTGDVEDHLIAAPPPPAYGNTRGSTLLLAGFLRNSLRAQRPSSGQIQNQRQSRQSQMSQLREERPVSYVSRDEQWEEIQDAERARRLEETLSRLERPLTRS